MNKKIYALLREKNKLECKRDELVTKLLLEVVNWNSWVSTKREKLYHQYVKITKEIKLAQQELELALANELSDRAEFWINEE